jgi:hypothetical protein
MTTTTKKPAAPRAARSTSATTAKPVAAAKPAAAKPAAEKAAAKKPVHQAYKILTGIDNAAFCDRVCQALAEGYELYGSPAITFDGKNNIVAQALVYKKKAKGKKK